MCSSALRNIEQVNGECMLEFVTLWAPLFNVCIREQILDLFVVRLDFDRTSIFKARGLTTQLASLLDRVLSDKPVYIEQYSLPGTGLGGTEPRLFTYANRHRVSAEQTDDLSLLRSRYQYLNLPVPASICKSEQLQKPVGGAYDESGPLGDMYFRTKVLRPQVPSQSKLQPTPTLL